jgi:hypothetical protein
VRSLGLAKTLAALAAACLVGCLGPGGPAAPISPVDGVVTLVRATGLTDVQGFSLRPSAGGPNLDFTLGPLENATQFPPGHLKEHQATGTPIRVYFTNAGGKLLVYRLEDAPVSSPVPSSSP